VTTQEHSVGPLYLATEEANSRIFWPHFAEVAEMCEPYRTGKVLVLPTGTHKLLAIGFWTRDIYDDVAEFPNRWPEWMQSYESDVDAIDPSWVKGARFQPRAMTEKELNETERPQKARGVDEES
jgi:hypothetical protein